MTINTISLEVQISAQQMFVFKGQALIATYSISSAKNGVGEQRDSFQTPRGKHIVRAKIGAGMPVNSVFVGRRATGEIYSPALQEKFPQRDWILTRILWLSGLERGKNRLGSVDSMQRYIYIHGTPDQNILGKPHSNGCIRMRNTDVIALFELVEAGTIVNIQEC